jgi:flagellin
MRINHNIAALNTYRQLTMNNINGAKSLEKLSSGYRINRAGDDAAGLAISEKMRAQIRGLGMASKNSQDAISLIQTAEGALSETQSILQRMRELAVQSANDTNVTVDRDQIQKEINQLTTEVNRIGNATEFNTMSLLNGDLAKTTATSESVQNSGVVTMSYASKVFSSAGNIGQALTSITLASGTGTFLESTTTVGSTAQVKVTATTAGLSISMTYGTAITTGTTITDSITLDSNGGYSYNNHGVSFSVSAANVALISAGASINIANISAGTTGAAVSIYSTYTTNSDASNAATLSNVSVTAINDNKFVRSFDISASTTGATIKLLNSGGATVDLDTFIFSALGSFVYNNHGISFTLNTTNMSVGATMSGVVSLTSLGTTTNALTYNDNSLQFQVGANENQILSLDVSDMRATALAISSTSAGAGFMSTKSVTNGTSSTASEYALDVSSATAAAAAITTFNTAITNVSEERAKLGSVQNRLEHTINNLDVTAENLQASESRIRDVDMAKEMMEFTKNNILMQAAQAMLAQANQQPQGVLQLLR